MLVDYYDDRTGQTYQVLESDLEELDRLVDEELSQTYIRKEN